MANAFHLQIVSPAQTVLDAYVPMVEIPGVEGDFGVLPNHAPFFSMIRPGVIRVTQSDGTHREFFAASGYADVNGESCTILSDHIQDVADISAEDAVSALAAAQTAVANAADDKEKAQAEKLLATAQALTLAIAA